MIASGNMIQVALAIIGRPDGSARDLEQMFDRKDRNCILIERTLKGELSCKQFEANSNFFVFPHRRCKSCIYQAMEDLLRFL